MENPIQLKLIPNGVLIPRTSLSLSVISIQLLKLSFLTWCESSHGSKTYALVPPALQPCCGIPFVELRCPRHSPPETTFSDPSRPAPRTARRRQSVHLGSETRSSGSPRKASLAQRPSAPPGGPRGSESAEQGPELARFLHPQQGVSIPSAGTVSARDVVRRTKEVAQCLLVQDSG